MNDDEYLKLQKLLIATPKIGDIIKGSGGLRKVRWRIQGKGKSGGLRVIYYHIDQENQIHIFFVYKKNV